tara:strand:- start:358 stop:2091 length:1734 start_codon:yes stop_codon:yes gene_type:complete
MQIHPHSQLSSDNGKTASTKDFDWFNASVPCQEACPAGTDIPGYLKAIYQGDYARAYRINLEDNVFPGVLGRVCSRPCEPACRHGWAGNGESVAICFAKRSAADLADAEPVRLSSRSPSTGRRVAVVGSGVAGLTAGRELSLWGHQVTVFEKHGIPGGLLNQGIPEFRLPRQIIRREIEQIRLAGVEIRCGVSVGETISLVQLQDEFDAVVMAAGAMKPHSPACLLPLPGGVVHGLDYLLDVNENGNRKNPGRTIVIGGGYTAMDCARTAFRLGAPAVSIYCRRRPEEIAVNPGELEEVEHEGITVEFCTQPLGIRATAQGRVAVEFSRTAGSASSKFDIETDTVLIATGQVPDTSWLDSEMRPILTANGQLSSGENCRTEIPGLFAAGDFSLGSTTLIDAIGHAKNCARAVDQYLVGRDRWRDVINIQAAETTERERDLNTIKAVPMSSIPLGERTITAEVESGLSGDEAATESSRCYLCNYKYEIDTDLCIGCDACLHVQPVKDCIVWLQEVETNDDGCRVGWTPSDSYTTNNLLLIDHQQCIRCGACVDVCPVEGCITLRHVQRQCLPDDPLPT